jgi:hypothetical protein
VHAGQDAHEGGLSGAVLADQGVGLAGVQVEAPVAQRRHGTEALPDRMQRE